LWNMRTRGSSHERCFVTVKLATSLDGQVALRSGESQWITSVESREKSHRLRLEHDAILVGRKTVEIDNPSLNVRLRGAEEFRNRAVILDPRAELLPRLLEDGADEKFNIVRVRGWDHLIVVVQDHKIPAPLLARARDRGVRVLAGIGSEGIMDLNYLTRELRREGVQGLFVEGGAGTLGPFFDQSIVNRLHVFMAPLLLGGREGVGWASQFGVPRLADAWKMKRLRVKKLGNGDALNMHWTGRLDL
jgi:diaminohydroxyphosphoribosylaminopyrimidine deaminase/5-amino-6-(5-phosphoribosylamino)uracil reductase